MINILLLHIILNNINEQNLQRSLEAHIQEAATTHGSTTAKQTKIALSLIKHSKPYQCIYNIF